MPYYLQFRKDGKFVNRCEFFSHEAAVLERDKRAAVYQEPLEIIRLKEGR